MTQRFPYPEETELCKLAYKYGTDKCPRINHSYTPFYYDLFKEKRLKVKKVLELGIYFGGSLKMWRDFFPNAMVYGSDIEENFMLEGNERIKTFLVDELNKEEMNSMLDSIGTDIDIVIDDASHRSEHQIQACKTLMPRLPDDVIYIIEDVGRNKTVEKALSEYDCEVPDLPRRKRWIGKLVIVRKKK